MGIRNDNGARRRMRGNTIDVDVSAQVSALVVRQHVGKFAGQSQRSPAAAKVNENTIFKCLTLHITGWPLAEPSIACATGIGSAVHNVFSSIFLKCLKYSVEVNWNTSSIRAFGRSFSCIRSINLAAYIDHVFSLAPQRHMMAISKSKLWPSLQVRRI